MELIHLAAHAAAFLLDVSLRSLPIFAAAGMAFLWMRWASASVRHLLWLVTLISLLLLPALCTWLPRWDARVLPTAFDRKSAQVPSTMTSAVPPQTPVPYAATSETGAATPERATPLPPSPSPLCAVPSYSPPKPTLMEWVMMVWLIGSCATLGRTAVGLLGAARLLRRCNAVTAGPLIEAADEAGRRLSIRRPIAVQVGSSAAPITIPMTFGLLPPIVLLPECAASWPVERLRVVMLHEIAHVKRRDWLTTMLAEVACALYWFHPFVWLAAYHLRAESEQACDDLVLTSGVQAVDYADHLLEVVRGLKGQRGPMPAVVTMAQDRDLTGRLKTILAESKNRSVATKRGLALAMIAALVMVMPLAAMHPVARLNLEKSDGRDAPRIATLPGGAQVELVRVDASNPVANTTTSFTPDGTALPKYSTSDGTIEVTKLHPDWHYIQGAWTSLLGNHNIRGSYDYFVLKTNAQVSYVVGGTQIVPRGDGRGDIQVTVATGNFDTLLTAPLIGTARRQLSTGETVLLSVDTHASPRIQIRGNYYPATEVSAFLPSRYVSDLSGFLIMPLSVGHKWTGLAPYRVSGGAFGPHVLGSGMQHVSFSFSTGEIKAKHISGFQFLYRPVHTLVFRNVALQPDGPAAHQLAPQASPLPAASPIDATGAPAVVNAVGGLTQVAKGVSLQLGSIRQTLRQSIVVAF